MANILFVVLNDLYVRNYLRTGVLDELRSHHSVSICCDSALELSEEIAAEPGYVGAFSLDEKTTKHRLLFFQILMWRHRKKSRTFYYRWLRLTKWSMVKTQSGPIAFLLSFLRWIANAIVNPEPFIVALLGSGLLFPLSATIFGARKSVTASFKELADGQQYDLIVFPSAAFEAAALDIIRWGKESDIPTVTLIDNWDNLTSKTVYWEKPCHIAVWGEQAKQQATQIHGFSAQQIHLIGTPRFDSYFAARLKTRSESPYPFPYLLFVGSAMPFDEIGALRKLEKVLESDGSTPEGLKVVYRPHPWQQKRSVPAIFRESDFSLTVLDRQIAEAYADGLEPEKTYKSFQPELSYYPALLGNAAMVVGPLTTMLFEAALCLKPVIALSYPDGHHFTTNRRYLAHFEGLEALPGFFFADRQSQLEKLVSDALSTSAINAQESDAVSSFYLYRDERSYPHRLLGLVNSLLPGATWHQSSV